MDERHDPKQLPRRLTAVTDLIAEAEGGSDDWLAPEEPTPTGGDSPGGKDGKADGRRRGGRARKRRLAPVGVGVVVVVVAAIVAAWQLRGTTAIADPSQAAGAARRAGSFAFETRSRLQLADSQTVESKVTGEVNLAHGGAFRVRVSSPLGVGFERIVFPKAVFVRPVGVRAAAVWFGARLSLPAVITVHSASGGGLADPLGLLAALAQSHAQYVEPQEVDHQPTRYYTLTLTLGKLLGASAHLSRQVARIPVEIGVWQNSEQQLVRAVRRFDIGGPQAERLTIQTDFSAYGKQATIVAPPGVHPIHTEPRLDSTADDPLGASVLDALAAGTGHGPTAVPSRAPRRRIPRGAKTEPAGGPTATP